MPLQEEEDGECSPDQVLADLGLNLPEKVWELGVPECSWHEAEQGCTDYPFLHYRLPPSSVG